MGRNLPLTRMNSSKLLCIFVSVAVSVGVDGQRLFFLKFFMRFFMHNTLLLIFYTFFLNFLLIFYGIAFGIFS